MGGNVSRRIALRGEHDPIWKGTIVIRFESKRGDRIFAEVAGSFWYRVGDEVTVLYSPEEPELALPAEVARLRIYDEAFNLAFVAVLYFGISLFLYWLFR
jgi:hypothetical protein